MQVIPAIDLLNGKCVRLGQGNYNLTTVYADNPVEIAKNFEMLGFQRLHVVDLDGAKAGKVINWLILKKIREVTKLVIDFGGGIKTEQELKEVLNIGVNYAVIGSLAIQQPEIFKTWLKQYEEKVILMLDVKDEIIMTSGWQQTSQLNIFDYLNQNSQWLHTIACTDISRDGMLNGPNFTLYQQLVTRYPKIQFIASGGVSSIADLKKLSKIGLHGAIVGKAIYEGHLNLDDLKTNF